MSNSIEQIMNSLSTIVEKDAAVSDGYKDNVNRLRDILSELSKAIDIGNEMLETSQQIPDDFGYLIRKAWGIADKLYDKCKQAWEHD